MTAKPLIPARLQLREYFCSDYAVALPDNVTLEDAMVPEFWSHINSHNPPKLRQHDIIRIIPENGGYFAELIVLTSGRGFANVKLLRHQDWSPESVAEEISDRKRMTHVKWQGPHVKWAVIRNSDKVRIKEGFQSEADAENAARDYESVVA